jgi:putrescine transport system substrate-binding protein
MPTAAPAASWQPAPFGRLLTALVTPFAADGSVDLELAARLADHLVTQGSDGLVICGTTGESPTLSWEEQHRLFAAVQQAVAGRAKLLAGSSGYDVVVPSNPFLAKQIKAGVFQKLDKSKLPNWKNLDPEVMKVVALHDPGNQYAVPWLWGTTGLGYNVAKVKAALGADVPVNSWALVFDPKYAAKLKGCGITLLDAPSEVIDSALIYLGLDPNSEKPEDLKAAAELLMSVRSYVKYYHSSQYINDLANGEVCVSLGWSGDVLQARDRAAEAKKGVEVAYVVPKEGAIMWFDVMAIPADAKHPDNAHAWINNAMDPTVIAGVSNFVNYANGVATSLPLVNDSVKNDPGIYPDAATRAKLHAHLAESQEYSREANRAWTRVRTGK